MRSHWLHLNKELQMFVFPGIKTTRTAAEQAQKIRDEIKEYFDDHGSDQEAVDILHAAETFVRVHFKDRPNDLKKLIDLTIKKNAQRGYYALPCY